MSNELQVEDDKNDPDRLADEAVVVIVTVPRTIALIPDAVFVAEKFADPAPPVTDSKKEMVDTAPPETWSSSASVSSINVSTRVLLEKRYTLPAGLHHRVAHGEPFSVASQEKS